MGNQSGKGSTQVSSELKKSKTSWTAGVPTPPGRPNVELTSRVVTPEDESITDEINITWTVPEDDGGYPITGYQVEMLDIQSGQWIEITFIEGYEPKCTLSNILYGIMYRFRIIALNDSGPSEAGEPSDPVVIDVPGVQIAPYFVHSLSDTMALEHEKIEFRVKVLGTPKPSVQWYKDDLELFASERLDIKEEDEGSYICLKGARLSDSGIIKCVASNILGRAVTSSQLFIESPPRFDVPENYLEGLIFRQDEVIRLKVGIVGKPTPKIVWFFEDEPITQGSDLTIETSDNFTSIRIPEAKRWHCGEFRCYAENENGEDAISILVTVTAPPASPGRPAVIDITETKCTLRWDPPDDDGGADVKQYIIEYFRDVWDVWLKAQTTKDTQVVIHDLIPGSRYKFRIKAENVYGMSQSGEESNPFDVAGSATDRAQDFGPPPQTEDEPQPKTRKSQILQETKRAWDSMSEDEDNILERFLKIKKLNDLRVPSYDSDGLPSIASVDIPDDSSVSSGSQRHPYAQSSIENPPDMETVSEQEDSEGGGDYEKAKKLFAELQQISFETGFGSVDNLIESMHSSRENVSSLIPPEKMMELNKFEMTLKEMIEEARLMADEADKNERTKSSSIQSIAETVIETKLEPPLDLPTISITPEYAGAVPFSVPATPPSAKKSPEPPARRSRPTVPSSGKRVADSSLPSVSRYDEIIKSRRSSLADNSVLVRSRGNSVPPPANALSYSPARNTPSPTPVQVRPLTMKLTTNNSKAPTKPVQPPSDSLRSIHVSIDPFHNESGEKIRLESEYEDDDKSRGLPAWLIITSTYSFVLVAILLISNVMPDGKLFIHFTAFWSMLIYFYLDDNGQDPVLDSLLGGFIVQKQQQIH